jgi:NAD(P)-dependent dehydrogenase (short-subunit alcohol dehydrogenase family)
LHYFRDKVALITGGASGIGAELARQLSRTGAAVVLADIDLDAAQKLAAELNRNGARVLACRTDVTRFADLESVVQTAVGEYGRLDLIFNNAGVGLAGELRDVELADWQPILNVNLWGVIHGVHAALPVMLTQRHGQIVNIASAAGLVPRPGMVPYAAAKHAVVGLSTSLRYEVEDLGIRVNVVCPFHVATSIFKNTTFRNIDGEAMVSAIPLRQLPVERCVEEILVGVYKNWAVITMPRFARFEWRLYRYFPRLAALLLRRRRSLFREHRRQPKIDTGAANL